MRSLLSKLFQDVRANTLMLPAIGSVALIGGAGLSVDTVQWYLWKRQLQQAVDSAALAGGLAKRQGTDPITAAKRELKRNASGATTVTISRLGSPPLTGGFAGDGQAVEVIADTKKALPFSGLFLQTPPTIEARAVAAVVVEGSHCVITLAKTGTGVTGSGSASVNLGCGVASNSKDAKAIDLSGTSYMRASPLSAVGGIDYDPKNIESGTDLLPYTIAQDDPMASRGLAVPSTPAACTANSYTVNPTESKTIGPGRYCNGITVRGQLEMTPGVYIVDKGNFRVNSQATVHGEGVTIILTGNSPSNVATTFISGGADVDLRAPLKDENSTWFNVLFYQDPMADYPTNVIAGDSNFHMQGIVYMPKGNIRFTGSSGQHSRCLLLVSYRVTFTGDSSFDDDCPEDFSSTDNGARRVKIVE